MSKAIGVQIDGVIELAEGETVDGLFDAFTNFLESRKCYFWGAHRGVDLDEVESDEEWIGPRPTELLSPNVEASILAKLQQLNEGTIETTRPKVRAIVRGQVWPYLIVDFKKDTNGRWYCVTYDLPQQTAEANG